jgi:hypothetical protein
MANARLENWNISVTMALEQWSKVLRCYREYRRRSKRRNLKRLQIEIQTMILLVFEDSTVLDNDTRAPIIMVYKEMVTDEEKLLNRKTLIACLMAVQDLLKRLGVYKINIGQSQSFDLTKIHEDVGQ